MKRTLMLALLVTAIGSYPASANIDPRVHKLCSTVQDYAGCVKAQSGESSSISSLQSEARSKVAAIKNKIYSGIRDMLIAEKPGIAEWAKANPELAKKEAYSEFPFFTDNDLKNWGTGSYDEMVFQQLKCKKRGEAITKDIAWANVCPFASTKKTVAENNTLIRDALNRELATIEQSYIEEKQCALDNKKLRKTKEGKLCMSDYEYSSYQEQQRARQAQEAYRREMMRQAEIDRKNAAIRRGLEAFGDSMKSLGESMQTPRRVNCYSNTYGNYTSTSCY